ncbi:MAG: alpha-amylase family glycosyl hydrolase [Chloroflexi bacterium]|nr:alpha-amylase family glycosyl hydrolase [Chloroflexota bacterium]
MALPQDTSTAADDFAGLDSKAARYRPESAWMQRLVLVAKQTPVWLEQLSQRYDRSITRLDQIPEEILEELKDRGFTAIWLVGIWKRSPVSKRIKQLMGHQNADASPYAIMEYEVSDALGGEQALNDLRQRASKFGLHLAADMVPNHTALDADWMMEQPDYYVSVPENPISVYSFGGENLSSDSRIELFLEDHYPDRSDAAVVFKRVDTGSGKANYVYHGNDGVGVPWNDTAQLDFLNEDVRQAVGDQIVDVARRFPIIRLDVAMALAKQHIRRLWHPQPEDGDRGWVETRQRYGSNSEEFETAIPEEFWREMVNRIEVEAPDTLLLAEAFWLMEGYFAHSLGMHRVYNSAFMHAMADEANAEFRRQIKGALAFDSRLLTRYVNFLSTPDEESARYRFGDGDKYLGAAVVLATLPGTPMFAHGQVEGLAERYSMDSRTPQLSESADAKLVELHARYIAPLLLNRDLFSGVQQFQLYDVWDKNNKVLEAAIAFSNQVDDQRALIVFNNSPTQLDGHIPTELAKGLSLNHTDHWGGQELIREDIFEWETAMIAAKGLRLSLAPYQAQVFWRFKPSRKR